MVLRNPQTRPSLGGLDQTKTKSDQTIPITGCRDVWWEYGQWSYNECVITVFLYDVIKG
ncbi:hypothetical protein FOXB_02356 [Fusarium oxysporum f. sp. conglutinans Fo5176]|uniref:Uncharacterized protein n=1 Tax=Fusarium oxysporum (strain Fo5176) TaxID=660025 RepID=F9F7I1_FUSOF|nr:hypothetical protein FOXB_02356 [Fusarium oxysporum f. sp. conglutinans Fo5176]